MVKKNKCSACNIFRIFCETKGKRAQVIKTLNPIWKRNLKRKIWGTKIYRRTFQRDKKTILKVTGIEISYSRSRDIYYISEEELTNAEESVLDNLLLIEAYRQTKSNSDIMIFERKARGLNHLNGIIHAIQNRKILGFTYHKFWTDETFWTDRRTLCIERVSAPLVSACKRT